MAKIYLKKISTPTSVSNEDLCNCCVQCYFFDSKKGCTVWNTKYTTICHDEDIIFIEV